MNQPTKEQAKQALQQIEGIIRSPDISGFTFDAAMFLRNSISLAFAYVNLSHDSSETNCKAGAEETKE